MSGSIGNIELKCSRSASLLSAAVKESVNVLNVTDCRICLSELKFSCLFPCGHKFCEKCVDTYWQTLQKKNHVVCPLCRACVKDISFASQSTECITALREQFGQLHLIKRMILNVLSTLFLSILLIVWLHCIYSLMKRPGINMWIDELPT